MKDYTYEEDGDFFDEIENAISFPGSLTQDEIAKLRERYKEIEERYNVEIADISADTMNSEILKEVTFNDEPDSEPLRIYMNWEDVMYDEDGKELSSYEMENKEADFVEYFLNNV